MGAPASLIIRKDDAVPTFEIEQYELHAMKYRVEAASEADAVVRLLDGLAMPVDNGLKYIDVADAFGLPADDYRDLADALRNQGVPVDAIIPSIRSIEAVE
jgi:hypothetical protein